jgi:hypothetical protein
MRKNAISRDKPRSLKKRGFGMWKRKPVRSLTYVNELRKRDRRTPQVFLKDMAEDE